MKRVVVILLPLIQACGFFGQNVTDAEGPLASFFIETLSSKKVTLDATGSSSFLKATNSAPSGYLEYQWTFQDLDGDYIDQKIEFASAGSLAKGNQSLPLVNGGTLRIKEKQHIPSVQYYAPVDGINEITIAACLRVRDADGVLNISPKKGLVCQNITLESAETQPAVVDKEFNIGGTLTGLSGTLVIQNNGRDDLTLNENGSFLFNDTVTEGEFYFVTILSEPVGQTCVVSNGSGVAASDVSNVGISCTTNTATIGGFVVGLTGTIVLQNNVGDNLSLTTNGNYIFPSLIAFGSLYSVTILTQPSGLTCSVSNGNGTATTNVSNVNINCSVDTYTVGGTVTGLSGTVIVENGGGDDETIVTNGSYTFNTALASGATYNITVDEQPNGQTCTVSNASGTISANVTNVDITCAANSYSVGGNVSGLSGTVVLQNNAGDNETINANGAYVFDTPILFNTGYNVTILTQPAGQLCSALNANGTVSGNVADVNIVCTTNTYTLGGSVSNLAGTLVLENNGGDDETINANGSYTFNTAIAHGSTYNVTVDAQPAGQTCTVSNGSGNILGTVNNVNIFCVNNVYDIGGSVSGLSGTVVLQNNGGDNETLTSNGIYTFNTQVPENGAYAVTVLTQPAGQRCTVANLSGSAASNVTNVDVTCQSTFSLGGTFTGVPAGASVTLIDNESGQAHVVNGVVTSTGSFTFTTQYSTTDDFDVRVQAQTSTLACTLVNETGMFTGSNITNLQLNCATRLCSPVETKYLKHCSPTATDAFGSANMVAISKNYAVVSTNLDDANSDVTPSNNALADSGAVFVYQRDDLSGSWVAVDFLKASNLAATDWFGYSVALDGENRRVIVGARQEDSNSSANQADNSLASAGAAYVFELNAAGNWAQVAYLKHPSPDATDNCGSTVAIDGNFAVMGCPDEDSNTDANPANDSSSASGCAIVYQRSGSGVWAQQDFLKASNLEANDQFGADVALSGNYLIVGSPGEDSNTDVLPGNNLASASGAAYIYRYDGVSNWAQQDYLKGSNRETNDTYGASVDVTEEGYAIVGARNEDSNSQAAPANNAASAAGAAYLYEWDGISNWAQRAYLKHSAPTLNDLYGIEVAISGNYAVVAVQSEDSDGPLAVNELSSGSGSAFVYERAVGGVWNQAQILKAFNLDAADIFGTSVSIHEDQLVVGAPGEDSVGTSPFNESSSASGAGYIFEFDGGGWLGD